MDSGLGGDEKNQRDALVGVHYGLLRRKKTRIGGLIEIILDERSLRDGKALSRMFCFGRAS